MFNSLNSTRHIAVYRAVLTLTATLMSYVLSTSIAQAAVIITEIQPLKYPTTVKNLNKSTVVIVNWKGNLGGGTNATLLDNDYYQGKYLVTSDSTKPITIEFFQLANETKVNLKTLRVRYKNKTYKRFPTVALENPGVNGEIISIGAKVVAGKKATAGQKSPQYVLRVTEQ
ncbi:hypothetical protein [Shewanella pneumatophori]|uniref:Uncharacterized protein n=1 Tax=Shewanella pneumatophori TaxID=314092 RepID=A0A9X1Z8G5_9GAMM|nr:hypothetical protein [Shewanella pneumatophori]MCL1137469.1 hypothetical protein [Shewanella pneumatophori]